MNDVRILIIDDDSGICQILSNIIEDNDLGEVIDTISDGNTGIDLIPKFRPDIVFVDLLLPDIDGIEIVNKIKKKYEDIDFIMVSQVSDTDMISEAYESGIEFYINKPINVIEVISVTKKVIKSQQNRRMIKQIGRTINKSNSESAVYEQDSVIDKIKVVFAELGILSEKGSKDIIQIILLILEDQSQGKSKYDIQISNLYKRLSRKYDISEDFASSSDKAIEQRIRRTLLTGLINIANLGIEDFGNYKFEKYSSLFGFQEVKKMMDTIRSGDTLKGTINIKVFITGMISLIERYKKT